MTIVDLQSCHGTFRGFHLILHTCVRLDCTVVINRPEQVMGEHNRGLSVAQHRLKGDEINDGGGSLPGGDSGNHTEKKPDIFNRCFSKAAC